MNEELHIDLGSDVIKNLQTELKKNDIEDWFFSKLSTELYYMAVDRVDSSYTLELVSNIETDGGSIGASTFLAYDDTICINREPSQKAILKHLYKVSNLPSNSERWFKVLVKKYSQWFNFNNTFLDAELLEGRGDRFRIYVKIRFEVIDKNKLTPQLVESFIKDLGSVTRDYKIALY